MKKLGTDMANGQQEEMVRPTMPASRYDVAQLAIDDTKASLAGLRAQVGSVEKDYADLKLAVVSLDRKMETSIANLNQQISAAIAGINNKLDERGKTPWSALGVILSAFIAVGAFAYWPIHTAEDETKSNLVTLTRDMAQFTQSMPDRYVTEKEHQRLIKQIEDEFALYRKDMVTRAEHEQHWAGIKDVENYMQKQVDEIARNTNTVWTARDQLEKLQRELDDQRATMNRILAVVPDALKYSAPR